MSNLNKTLQKAIDDKLLSTRSLSAIINFFDTESSIDFSVDYRSALTTTVGDCVDAFKEHFGVQTLSQSGMISALSSIRNVGIKTAKEVAHLMATVEYDEVIGTILNPISNNKQMFKVVKLKYDVTGVEIIKSDVGQCKTIDEANTWIYNEGFNVLTKDGHFTKAQPIPNNVRLVGYKVEPYIQLENL